MRALDRLPTEMIREIFGQLEESDIRTLRLVSRTIGAIADSFAMKEIGFCMSKQDFNMLHSIANHPVYPTHVASLMYLVDTLSLERQTLEMYTRAVHHQDDRNNMLKEIDPHHFDSRGGTPPILTEAEMVQDFHRYQRFYEEQDDILANNRDYETFKEVIAKLPNLRDVAVSSCNELRVQPIENSPFKSCRHAYDGKFVDGRAATRHLRAILSGVRASGTQLQSIRAASIHNEFFNDAQFGLHNMTDLLQNLTFFEMMIDGVEDKDNSWGEDDPDEIRSELAQCRAMIHRGVLRRVLDSMPNLVTLKLLFVEHHSVPRGTFPAPVVLSDVISLGRVWPKLKHFTISNVESDRQELGRFLVQHKGSLESFGLDQVRLASSSWLRLLPYLKSEFRGTQVKPMITDLITGKSEDAPHTTEAWSLGHPEFDDPKMVNSLGPAVTKYLMSRRKRSCPLREDNMVHIEPDSELELHDGDPWEDISMDESDFGEEKDESEDEDEDEDEEMGGVLL